MAISICESMKPLKRFHKYKINKYLIYFLPYVRSHVNLTADRFLDKILRIVLNYAKKNLQQQQCKCHTTRIINEF